MWRFSKVNLYKIQIKDLREEEDVSSCWMTLGTEEEALDRIKWRSHAVVQHIEQTTITSPYSIKNARLYTEEKCSLRGTD
jgi:uncharacterized protein (DUF2461 family)